jgi:hypothetical protein
MVPDARGGLRQVAAGGLEEFQHRLVFERGRIGEVDHDLRAVTASLTPSPVMVLRAVTLSRRSAVCRRRAAA